MDLEGVASLDCCRLVKYDEFHEYLERSYEGEEDTPMGLLLGGVKSSYMFDLLLETRRPEQAFQPYKPGGQQRSTRDLKKKRKKKMKTFIRCLLCVWSLKR